MWSLQILIRFLLQLLLLLVPPFNTSTRRITSKSFWLHSSTGAARLPAAPVNHPQCHPPHVTIKSLRDDDLMEPRLKQAAVDFPHNLFFFLLLLPPFISDSPGGEGFGGRGGGGTGQVAGSGGAGGGKPVRTGRTSLSCGGS